MQLTFGDAQELSKGTRRYVFLNKLNQVVPWKLLLVQIVPFNPKAGRRAHQAYTWKHCCASIFAAAGCLERPGDGISVLRYSTDALPRSVGRQLYFKVHNGL